jgi:hypothetical protein
MKSLLKKKLYMPVALKRELVAKHKFVVIDNVTYQIDDDDENGFYFFEHYREDGVEPYSTEQFMKFSDIDFFKHDFINIVHVRLDSVQAWYDELCKINGIDNTKA